MDINKLFEKVMSNEEIAKVPIFYTFLIMNSRTKMVEKLSTLMDDTMSEHERNAIMDCIDKIK